MTGRLLSYFPDEEILAQRGRLICPNWNSWMMKELRRAPQFADIFWRGISSPSTPYPCFFFPSTSFPCLHYSFPWDAVTNDYKLSGLRQHTLICLQFWRPEVGSQYLWLKSKCWQDHTPFRGSRGIIHFQSFPASAAAFLVFLGSWPPPPSSQPAAQHLLSQILLSSFPDTHLLFHGSQTLLSVSIHTWPSFSSSLPMLNLPLPLSCKDTCDCIEGLPGPR